MISQIIVRDRKINPRRLFFVVRSIASRCSSVITFRLIKIQLRKLLRNELSLRNYYLQCIRSGTGRNDSCSARVGSRMSYYRTIMRWYVFHKRRVKSNQWLTATMNSNGEQIIQIVISRKQKWIISSKYDHGYRITTYTKFVTR